jgi:hypothetical protein
MRTLVALVGTSSSPQQARDRDVLVQLVLMDSNTATDETPPCPLLDCGVSETWEPFKRNGDLSTVEQSHI